MENRHANFELEEMRQQIQLLKDKLDKESLVNEKMITRSVMDKLAGINRKNRILYALTPLALIYCNLFFTRLDYSWMFCVVTSLFLIVACLYHFFSHKGVDIKEISTGNLMDVSKALIRMNRLGIRWLCLALPFALLWLAWFVIESYPKEYGESICTGCLVGFAAGAVFGLKHLKDERRKAKEAIREIEEYTKED